MMTRCVIGHHADMSTSPLPTLFTASRAFALLAITMLTLTVALLQPPAASADVSRQWVLDGGEPTLAHKIWLYQQSGARADVIVAGSSRTLRIAPSMITARTGTKAFNFGVSGGSFYEAWQALRFVLARDRAHMPHLVLGLEPDSFNRRRTPRRSGMIARQLTQGVAPAAIARYARATIRPRCATCVLRPDGSVPRDVFDTMFARGITLDQRLDQTLAKLTHPGVYRKGHFDHLYAQPKRHLDALLALANAHGDQPVLVISPIQPRGWSTLAPRGLSHRRAEMLAYLDELHTRRDFRVIDLAFIQSFGGDARYFYDWQHMNNVNAWRVVAELHRQGALRNQAAD